MDYLRGLCVQMRTGRFSYSLLLPVLAFLSACGSDTPTPPTDATPTRPVRVSGSVTSAAGVPTGGVTIDLTTAGSAMRTTQTDATGAWAFDSVTRGTYTIRPTRTGMMFTPAQRVVTVDTSDVGAITFEATVTAPAANRPDMVPTPAGEFVMGTGADGPPNIRIPVRLTKPLWVAITETTQEQYERVIGNNPSIRKVVNGPVTDVTPQDMARYCNKLSELEGFEPAYTSITGTEIAWNHSASGYRLPTNAEWEFVARAGDTSAIPGVTGRQLTILTPEELKPLDAIAWYLHNCASPPDYKDPVGPMPVGLKLPNAWGLYDVLGNVLEAVYGRRPGETQSTLVDPVGSYVDFRSIPIRGGDFLSWWQTNLRAAGYADMPESTNRIGFRVVRNR